MRARVCSRFPTDAESEKGGGLKRGKKKKKMKGKAGEVLELVLRDGRRTRGLSERRERRKDWRERERQRRLFHLNVPIEETLIGSWGASQTTDPGVGET